MVRLRHGDAHAGRVWDDGDVYDLADVGDVFEARVGQRLVRKEHHGLPSGDAGTQGCGGQVGGTRRLASSRRARIITVMTVPAQHECPPGTGSGTWRRTPWARETRCSSTWSSRCCCPTETCAPAGARQGKARQATVSDGSVAAQRRCANDMHALVEGMPSPPRASMSTWSATRPW